MAEIVLKLNEKKKIGGKEIAAGTAIFTGTCVNGISPDDLNKAIQLNQVRVEIPKVEAAKKEVKKEK